ncbi:MAG: MerR family transcriptional regulator [Deltaproteobacteria bacterium]|nr:MerR family transcriptional regulator [Deltaproteobacteria bacterium]MBW2306725.1 MerR family transcriptional regulator [Deltaproteobacteria bacterium]
MKLTRIPIADNAARKSYSSTDIRKIYGLAQRTLAYWYDQGLLIPEIEDATGRGNRRRYSFIDVILAGIIQRYIQFGLSHKDIRDIIKRVRKRLKERYSEYNPWFLAVVLQEEDIKTGGERFWAVDVIPLDAFNAMFGMGGVHFADEKTGELISPDSLPKLVVILYLASIMSRIVRHTA